MTAIDMEKQVNHSTSIPRTSPVVAPGTLRRSARLVSSPNAPSANVEAASAPSTKRKRTSSTSSERYPNRNPKRTHLTAETPLDASSFNEHLNGARITSSQPLRSARTLRHLRRHPSVCDDGVGSDTELDLKGYSEDPQSVASTSYLPPLVEGDVTVARRARKKENITRKSQDPTNSRRLSSEIQPTQERSRHPFSSAAIPAASLKGKGKVLPGPFAFSAQTSIFGASGKGGHTTAAAADALHHPSGRSTRSHSRSRPTASVPPSSDLSHDPPTSTDTATDADSESSDRKALRRGRSARNTPETASMSMSRKRKRRSTAGDKTSIKKLKLSEPEEVQVEMPMPQPAVEAPAGPPRIDESAESEEPTSTSTSPAFFPSPIPELIITPPTPSPPPSTQSPEISNTAEVSTADDCSDTREQWQETGAESSNAWDWCGGAALPPDFCVTEDTSSTASTPEARGRSLERAPNRAKRVRRVRRGRKSPISDKPGESMFKIATRERLDHLLKLYAAQVREYEADQAVEFFTAIASRSLPSTPDPSSISDTAHPDSPSSASASSPTSSTQPQSPTWHFMMHWEDRRQDVGEWDGETKVMHPSQILSPPPLALPPLMLTQLPSEADHWALPSQPWLDQPTQETERDATEMELDYRTEDCYEWELVESDEEDGQELEEQSASDKVGEEEGRMDEDDDSGSEDDEDENLPTHPVEGEMVLPFHAPASSQLPTSTPSSLAEALTPLSSGSDDDDIFEDTHSPSSTMEPVTGVFALKVEPEPEHDGETRFPESPSPDPPVLPLPPPPLVTIVPEQTRLDNMDMFTFAFKTEVLPMRSAVALKAWTESRERESTMDEQSPFAETLLPRTRRSVKQRLLRPHMRLLNYTSRTLGSIAQGTPIDPERRRKLVAWLEEQNVANRTKKDDASTCSRISHEVEDDDEHLPSVGSSEWYAVRFPSPATLDASLAHSNVPILSTGSPVTSTPSAEMVSTSEASLGVSSEGLPSEGVEPFSAASWASFFANDALEAETEASLGIGQHGDLANLVRWREAKAVLKDGVGASSDGPLEFQQGSSHDHDVHFVPNDRAEFQRGSTRDGAGNMYPSSGLSPEIAMDESLSDEDAEGDIDPDVDQPVSLSAYELSSTHSPSSTVVPSGSRSVATDEPHRSIITAVAHQSSSFESSSLMGPLPGVQQHLNNGNDGIGFGASVPEPQDTRRSIFGSNNGGLNMIDFGMHGSLNAGSPLSGPAVRSLSDNAVASFTGTGVHGVGMNLNVGVSVGLGMGMSISRFGMDVMGLGMGMGLGLPALDAEAWLPPSPSSLSSPGANGEETEHSLGALGRFGSSSMYIEDMPDHTRERFSRTGSPESAYPLGFAMG